MPNEITISEERYQELLQCENDLNTLRNWNRRKGVEYSRILDMKHFLEWLETHNDWFSSLKEQWEEKKKEEEEIRKNV